MKPIVAYIRVSTSQQGRSGLGIEAQREALARFANGRRFRNRRRIRRGRNRQGKRCARPAAATGGGARQGALAALPGRGRQARPSVPRRPFHFRPDGASGSLCGLGTRPGRRSVRLAPLCRARRKRARLDRRAHEVGACGSQGQGRQARQSAYRGRARIDAVAAIKAEADRAAANVLPIIAEIQKSGAATLRAIAEALNARGVPTPRGGRWHAMSVRNVLVRA